MSGLAAFSATLKRGTMNAQFESEPYGTVSVDDYGDVRVVRLVGEHDINTAKEVRAQLDASVTADGLVVSIAEIEFLDSAIVHALFQADRRMRERDRRLVLHVGTPVIVERVLDLSGLKRQMHCTESLDEALVLAEQPAESTGWSTK
jgi:anti-anti-sigma factor